MADYVEVDTLSMARDREVIQSEAGEIQAELERLREYMTSLGAMWEGPAHQTFMEQFQADYAFVQDFIGEIRAYAETIAYAEGEYQKCDDAVQQIIAEIRI